MLLEIGINKEEREEKNIQISCKPNYANDTPKPKCFDRFVKLSKNLSLYRLNLPSDTSSPANNMIFTKYTNK